MPLTAAITRDGSWWVARCEVEVTSQGETFDQAQANPGGCAQFRGTSVAAR